MMDREIGAIFQSGTFQLLYASIRDVSFKEIFYIFERDLKGTKASVICYVLINKNVLIYKNICSYYKNML